IRPRVVGLETLVKLDRLRRPSPERHVRQPTPVAKRLLASERTAGSEHRRAAVGSSQWAPTTRTRRQDWACSWAQPEARAGCRILLGTDRAGSAARSVPRKRRTGDTEARYGGVSRLRGWRAGRLVGPMNGSAAG